MTRSHFGQAGICLAVCIFVAQVTVVPVRAPSQEPVANVTVQGYVRDSNGKPVAKATVILQFMTATEAPSTPQTTQTDSEGAYRFAALQAGTYTVRTEKSGYIELIVGPVDLAPKQTKTLDLTLVSSKASALKDVAPGTATGKLDALINTVDGIIRPKEPS